MNLKEKYKKQIIPEMMKVMGYKNIMAVPKLEKAVLNTGFGKMLSGKTGDEQKKAYTAILEDLALIAGQKPVLTRAKKSIAAFKLRQGMPVGAKVTLRGAKMYDLIERLINIALPRSRDFRGLDPKSIDKKGNLTIAIKEHIIFPEVSPEKARSIFGLEATVVASTRNKEEALKFFKMLGFPIK